MTTWNDSGAGQGHNKILRSQSEHVDSPCGHSAAKLKDEGSFCRRCGSVGIRSSPASIRLSVLHHTSTLEFDGWIGTVIAATPSQPAVCETTIISMPSVAISARSVSVRVPISLLPATMAMIIATRTRPVSCFIFRRSHSALALVILIGKTTPAPSVVTRTIGVPTRRRASLALMLARRRTSVAR